MNPEILETLQELTVSIGKDAVYLVLRILGALLILIVGSKLIKFGVKRFKKSKIFAKLDAGLANFAVSAVKIGLYIVLCLTLLWILGIETASVLALFTAGGVAISLAFQGAVSNLAGGVMLLLFRPFRVGDYVEAAGVSGTVKEINVLYTVLTTPDNKRVTVPNGTLTNSVVTDYSVEKTRRLDIKVTAAYSSDIDLVRGVMLDLAKAHPLVLQDPAPAALLSAQADSALEFTLRVWCNNADYWTVNGDLNIALKKAFDENNIEIPFPQLDVHMK